MSLFGIYVGVKKTLNMSGIWFDGNVFLAKNYVRSGDGFTLLMCRIEEYCDILTISKEREGLVFRRFHSKELVLFFLQYIVNLIEK